MIPRTGSKITTLYLAYRVPRRSFPWWRHPVNRVRFARWEHAYLRSVWLR